MLVREAESTLHWMGRGKKLEHERWSGPWTIKTVLQQGLSVEVEMEGRHLRRRKVPTSLVKPFYSRPIDLRHPMADEFALQAWLADFGLLQRSTAARPLYTRMDRKEIPSNSDEVMWECRGKYQDGSESPWLPEEEVLDSFTPLQLDVFHAIWNLHQPRITTTSTVSQRKTKHLSREEALDLFPIGTRGIKSFGNQDFQGQVYSFLDGMWRVRYVDNDWEDLTRAQMERFVQKKQDRDVDFRVD